MGFSRQEYWSGLPCPPPGDLPNPGIEPRFPALQADSLLSEPVGLPLILSLLLSFPLCHPPLTLDQSKALLLRGHFTQWLSNKESSCSVGDAEDVGSIPGLGRSPGGGNDNPFQYSCLENPTDRGAWRAIVHGFTKSRTRLE